MNETKPNSLRLFIVALLLPMQLALGGEGIVSKYTSTAKAQSLSFKEDNEEPGGGFQALFAGLGGYQLLHFSGDERSWIDIRYGNKTADLYDATMRVGPGTFPRKANEVVEWRGLERGGRFEPFAIIYRLKGNDEEKGITKTRLIVIKLNKEHSTVIGFAEGADEDAEAKKIADKVRPP